MKPTLGLLPLVALSAALAGPAFAQTTTTPTQDRVTRNAEGEIVIEQVNVEGGSGENNPNTVEQSTGIGRLPGRVMDTPQVVNVVTPQVIQQQNAQTLEQILRNVPGVTMAIGEGGGGMNGDQFKIRGFEAKGDIYTDGLRDFGVYVRDSFATEEVQVFKGPSSESFGMGTTGGAINSRLKAAHLGDTYSIDGTLGTGLLGRIVVDVNKQINDTTAIRLVGMGNWQDVPDRDNNKNDRAGFLATAAFGIGTDFTWNLSYFYQHGDRTPDYGVPMVTKPGGTIGQPITEYGIPRSNFYGKSQDQDISNVNAVTSKAMWEAKDWLTIYNDTRLSFYDRDFATSVPSCTATEPVFCQPNFWNGVPTTISGYGGGNPAYDQSSWGIQNITTGVAEFNTGQFKHQMVGGLDLFYQDDNRKGLMVVGTKTLPDLWDPSKTYDDDGYTLVNNPNNVKDSDATDIALFLSDRMWFTDEISVLAGLRWDNYTSSYTVTSLVNNVRETNSYDSDSSVLSPKASLIWEPNKQQSYYVSWARSFSPPGQYVTNANAPINGSQPDLEPEENDLWELGAKYSLLDNRLGLTASLFQIDKSNAYYYQENGDAIATGEEQRVRGIELGASGQVTDLWTIGVAYSYLDSKILSTPPQANGQPALVSTVGNEVPYAPQNAASIWTSYEVSKHFEMDGKLLAGGGIYYSDGYFTNSTNLGWIPDSFSLDMFASYEFKQFRIQGNVYNLTDELNYSTGWSNRAVPGPGRTFALTVGATF